MRLLSALFLAVAAAAQSVDSLAPPLVLTGEPAPKRVEWTITGEEARALVRKIETQYLGKTSFARARMSIVTEYWSRKLTMKMWGEGRDKFLTRIVLPKKERGTATLKVGDELWNYLPKIDRLMKIPSNLMGDSWMGSHLTNDDLVKENKIDELYDFKARPTTGRTVIVGTPKPDAAVVWGRIEYEADLERSIPVEIRYYDEDGARVRTMTFDRVEKISGRWVPLRLKIQPVDDPGESTTIVYEALTFDEAQPEGFYSLRALRRR